MADPTPQLLTYLLIDDAADPPFIETLSMWDGVTPFDPPYRMELQTDPANQQPGAQFIEGQWRLPVVPETTE